MKKGQSAEFNWIFVIVAGAIILIFFSVFALRFKDLQDKKDSAEIARNIDNLIYGFSATTQYNTVSAGFIFDLKLNCDDFIVNDYYEQSLGNKIVFGAKEIKSKTLVIWTKDFNKPFKVATLAYIINPNQDYYLIGDNSLNDFPNVLEENIHKVNSLSKNNSGVFVFFSEPNNLNDLKTRGKVIIVNNDTVKFVNSGKEAKYFDEATLLAAIFSEDYDNYKCNLDKLTEEYENLLKIYYGKANYLSNFGNCDYSLIKGMLKKEVNLDKLNEFSSDLEQENERLWQNGCEVIF